MSACVGFATAALGHPMVAMGMDLDGWIERFHRGDRSAIEECYREHYAGVDRVVGSILRGADKETVVHELFFRLLTQPDLRAHYTGGSLAAWLHTLARNQAIDLHRRRRRDVPLEKSEGTEALGGDPRIEEDLDAKRLIARFRREVLPPAWEAVFDKRFLEQLDQREAAKRIGISRTTLAYRELRIRSLLRAFLLAEDAT